MLDANASTLAEIDAEIASLNAEMTALWLGPIKAAYKAKMNAIEDSIKPRCDALKILRLVETDPSFENETAYARAYRPVKDANESIREALDEHVASLVPWYELKATRDAAMERRAALLRNSDV